MHDNHVFFPCSENWSTPLVPHKIMSYKYGSSVGGNYSGCLFTARKLSDPKILGQGSRNMALNSSQAN